MSKHARRRRPTQKAQKSPRSGARLPDVHTRHDNTSAVIATIVAVAVTVVLAGIPFALGKYFEFNSPDAFDSACYVYSAQKILSGAKIGVDEKPSAQLGTLLVNLLGVRVFGFSETGPKFIQMLMQLAALVLMYLAMRKLFGNLAAGVGVVLASFYLSAPLIAKVGNVKEQYMIACMVAGVSCLVLYQLGGRRWWIALIAGALISWAPLFKPTGVSAMTAVGLFVLIQPVIKARTWRQTGQDILLLAAGALLALAPVYIWILGWRVQMDPPYAFALQALGKIIPIGAPADGASNAADYVIQSRKMMPFDQQVARIMGNYKLLLLPILLAAAGLLAGIGQVVDRSLVRKSPNTTPCAPFLVLFTAWWLLDMAFVWISPRSYIQYYLPLTASAAMLTGFLLASYSRMLAATLLKARWNVLCVWVVVGMFGAILILLLAWEPLWGMREIPSRYSYAEKLKDISDRKTREPIGWEKAGEYIGSNTQSGDTIYVWGWYPGIYVKAQRLSSAPKAFEGTMHTLPPEELGSRVQEILGAFKEEPPKFIVDSKKVHFPWNRPPLELWPQTRQGFLRVEENAIREYDAGYGGYLRENIAPDEAERYAAMKPFRDYVMANYQIVEPGQFVRLQDGRVLHRMFGTHVVFRRK